MRGGGHPLIHHEEVVVRCGRHHNRLCSCQMTLSNSSAHYGTPLRQPPLPQHTHTHTHTHTLLLARNAIMSHVHTSPHRQHVCAPSQQGSSPPLTTGGPPPHRPSQQRPSSSPPHNRGPSSSPLALSALLSNAVSPTKLSQTVDWVPGTRWSSQQSPLGGGRGLLNCIALHS
jgi:hypothetical protein